MENHLTATGSVHPIDFFIGRTVIARATANKLGQIHDLVVDPVKGELSGLFLRMADESLRLIDYREIYSFGADAVMVNTDESAMPVEKSTLKAAPLAKNNLIGVKIITEDGKLLGQITNLYVHLAETSIFIYEVRSSLLDKLLGHSMYFPASGSALSEDKERLVVPDDTAAKADNNLDALVARLFGTPTKEPMVTVRSRSR